MAKKIKYESDIQLGKKYRCKDTGVVGIADAIYFFRNACERVTLLRLNDGKVTTDTFDSVQLIDVETEKAATSPKTGGPTREVSARPEVSVR